MSHDRHDAPERASEGGDRAGRMSEEGSRGDRMGEGPLSGGDWQAAWETENNYWTENFSSRPYAMGPDYYDRFRPAYRYGFESAHRNPERGWDDVEPELQSGWDRYEHGGQDRSAWETIKDAVRDAFDRARRTPPGTHLTQ